MESVFGDFVNYTGIYVQTDAQVDGKFDLIYDVDPENIIKGKNIHVP